MSLNKFKKLVFLFIKNKLSISSIIKQSIFFVLNMYFIDRVENIFKNE